MNLNPPAHNEPRQQMPVPRAMAGKMAAFMASRPGAHWQRQHFLATLHILLLPPVPLARQMARRVLLAAQPADLQRSEAEALVDHYLAELAYGMAQRRQYLPRMVAEQKSSDTLAVPEALMSEFAGSMKVCQAQIRGLFMEELRCVLPHSSTHVSTPH